MLNKEIATVLAIKYNTTPTVIEHIYNEYWKWLKCHVAEIDFHSMTEPQPIHANMAIPGIGKLIVDETALRVLNERHSDKKDTSDE